MEEWIDGQQRFIEYKCPVKECILTSDYDNKSLTADALLITEVDSNSIKKYLPKPPHQIWIVRHQVSTWYLWANNYIRMHVLKMRYFNC